jgi:hypothetical protein
MPEQYSQEEVRDRFLGHLRAIVDYWGDVAEYDKATDTHQTIRSRLSGLAFSFLTMLDGVSMDMPAFEIYPSPHPEDKEYRREQDEDWWPPLEESVLQLREDASVHGEHMLHDLWHISRNENLQPVVCLSGEEAAKLVAFADEGDRQDGTTAWGPKFTAVMEIAQVVRARVKRREKSDERRHADSP